MESSDGPRRAGRAVEGGNGSMRAKELPQKSEPERPILPVPKWDEPRARPIAYPSAPSYAPTYDPGPDHRVLPDPMRRLGEDGCGKVAGNERPLLPICRSKWQPRSRLLDRRMKK
jgi:hypothetical protein